MSEYEAKQIYFPTLKAMNTKNFQEVKPYGRYDTDYHWFNLPHHLEFKQNIQVTIYCSFDFHDFPFDSHHCDFNIGIMFKFYQIFL